MENLFAAVKKKAIPYHAIILFSGGKDSTILLKMAKEKYGLRTLAFSVMHPLVNDAAKKNIEDVAKKLNVELVKAYPDEEVYKKCIKLGILRGPGYGLGEFFGCDVCSFFHMWIPIRYAMRLGIPVILEGSDLSQTGEIAYHQSERVKNEIQSGRKPFGGVHDLVMDALGEGYKGSIYDCDEREIIEGKYPTIISPFSFLDYDYRENFAEIEKIGLKRKEFRSIYTNCSATPFFSYFSLKRFDCVSYIKHYAAEVRRGYPNLMQRSLKDDGSATMLNKEVIEKLMEEYKNVVLYIGEKKLSEDKITEEETKKLKGMASTYLDIFGEDVCDVFLHDVLQIPKYADYFGVNLDK
jgi:tRNA(Ile)-lysidine synthase TilS/MesJ